MWSIKEDLPVWTGALATAGDVVFCGTMDGWFKAFDAQNGKLLVRLSGEVWRAHEGGLGPSFAAR